MDNLNSQEIINNIINILLNNYSDFPYNDYKNLFIYLNKYQNKTNIISNNITELYLLITDTNYKLKSFNINYKNKLYYCLHNIIISKEGIYFIYNFYRYLTDNIISIENTDIDLIVEYFSILELKN